MESADKGNEPTPNVLLMLALAVGMWGLLYLGLRAAGPGRNHSDIAVEAESVPQLANLSNLDLPRFRGRVRSWVQGI
jgi:hypothetical protein